MSALELTFAAEDASIAVLKVNQRINLGNVDELMQMAQQAHDGGTRRLLLDLSGMESVTSAGLRVILSMYKMFGGQSFKLAGPTGEVVRILQIAGMAERMSIFPTVAEAIASYP